MFKLVVLSAVLAISAAAPSLEHHHSLAVAPATLLRKELSFSTQPLVHTSTVLKPTLRYETHPVETTHVHQPEPIIQKVGEVVEHIPTGVTHHSSSIVHNLAPVVKQVVTPIEKKIIHQTPVFESRPIVKTYHAEPIVHHVEHAPIVKHIEAAPIFNTFEATPLIHDSSLLHHGAHFGGEPIVRHGW